MYDIEHVLAFLLSSLIASIAKGPLHLIWTGNCLHEADKMQAAVGNLNFIDGGHAFLLVSYFSFFFFPVRFLSVLDVYFGTRKSRS